MNLDKEQALPGPRATDQHRRQVDDSISPIPLVIHAHQSFANASMAQGRRVSCGATALPLQHTSLLVLVGFFNPLVPYGFWFSSLNTLSFLELQHQ